MAVDDVHGSEPDDIAAPVPSRRGGQAGLTLLEVMIAVAVVGIIMVSLFLWAGSTLLAQTGALQNNLDTNGFASLNTQLIRDVSSAKFAATDAGGALANCSTAGAGETVKLVLITPGNVRITYALGPGEPGTLGGGQSLIRRECENNTAVLGTSDSTLNDSFLTGGPYGSVTAGARYVVAGLDDVSASCPKDDGTGVDPECTTVKLSLDLEGVSRAPVVFQATRRTDTYCAPGCPPIARFTTTPLIPEINQTVTFDATISDARRGRPVIGYQWDLDGDGTFEANGVQVTRSYPTVGTYAVTLRFSVQDVRPDGLSRPPLVAETTLQLRVTARRPTARITPSPDVRPVTAIRGRPKTFTGLVNSFDGATIDPSNTYWQLGDDLTRIPLAGCNVTATTCTETRQFTFAAMGLQRLSLTVTDTNGLSRTALLFVDVESDIYYVRNDGVDNATCGPIATPCLTIQQGIDRAHATGRVGVRVADAGPYAPFSMRSGISVTGGYSHDFLQANSVTTVVRGPVSDATTNRAILAAGITEETTIANLSVDGGTAPSGRVTTGIDVSGGTGLVLDNLIVTGGTGADATGVLVRANSIVVINGGSIHSGTTVGAGASAYGVRALSGSQVTLNGTTVTAANGQRGSDATGQANAGGVGVSGSRGQDAPGSSGGPAGIGAGANGGNGGGGGVDGGNGGASGSSIGGAAGGSGGGGGSAGGWSWFSCTSAGIGGGGGGGRAGSPAGVAASGNPGVDAQVSSTAWAATRGGTGNGGGAGAGGGGGGGGGGSVLVCGDDRGASGGGGGAGGAGGSGGAGGYGGGASVGVFAVDARVVVNDQSPIIPGVGGRGGDGQRGGNGGNGGNGGSGGNAPGGGDGAGGGGAGGGGAGGGGGGGQGGPGGPSIGVYLRGSASMGGTGSNITLPNVSALPTGGSGGSGGNGGNGGSGGGRGSGGSGGGSGGAGSTSTGSGIAGTAGPAGTRCRIFVNSQAAGNGVGGSCNNGTVAELTGAVIASAGYETRPGYVRQGGTFYVYANALPVAGTTVTADLTGLVNGPTASAVPLTPVTPAEGTVGGVVYSFRSALQTARNPLAPGSVNYLVSARVTTSQIEDSGNFSVTVDNTAPVNGAVTYTDGNHTSPTLFVVINQGSESGEFATSGNRLEQRTATLSGGTCGTYGGWTTAANDPSTPYPHAVTSGLCYQYRYVVHDAAGNEAVYTGTATARVDYQGPAGGTLSYANARYSTSTNVGWQATLTFSPGADAANGLAANVRIERATTRLQADACDTANWSDWGLRATLATSATSYTDNYLDNPDSICYRYRYVVTDNVGNETAYESTTGAISKVDLIYPANGYVSYAPGPKASPSVLINFNVGTDSNGIDTTNPERPILRRWWDVRRPDGTCAWTGNNYNDVVRPTGNSIVDNGTTFGSPMVAGRCYQYWYYVTDVYDNLRRYTTAPNNEATLSLGQAIWIDDAAPTGGSVTYIDGLTTARNVTVTLDPGTDDDGIADSGHRLQRRTAPFQNGVCVTGSYSGWTDVVTDPVSPYSDPVPSDVCVQYRYLVLDRAGNVSTYTGTATAMVDYSGPVGATISYRNDPPYSHITNYGMQATINLTPGTDVSHSLGTSARLERSSTTLANGSCLASGWTAYTTVPGAGNLPITQTSFVDVYPEDLTICYRYRYISTDSLGNESAPATPTNGATSRVDTRNPAGGAVSYRPGPYRDSVVDVTVTRGSDANGLQSLITLRRWEATRTGNTCTGWGGVYVDVPNPVAGVNHIDTSVLPAMEPGKCYQFWYYESDLFGNQTRYSTAPSGQGDLGLGQPIFIDATAPTGGSVTYTNGPTNATSLSIALTQGTDENGIAQTGHRLERRTAPLAGGACGTWGTWNLVIENPTTPYSDPVSSGDCVQYRYIVRDNAGNEAFYTGTATAMVDRTGPAGAAISYPDRRYNLGGFTATITLTPGTDAATALGANARVERSSTALANQTCDAANWSPYSTIGTVAGTATTFQDVYPDPTTQCFRYRYVSIDQLGNESVAYPTGTPVSMVDVVPPAGGSVAYTPGEYGNSVVTVTITSGTDPNGLSPDTILRRWSGPIVNGACTWPGTFDDVTNPIPGQVTIDSSVLPDMVPGNCYQFWYYEKDSFDNLRRYTTAPDGSPTLGLGQVIWVQP